MSDSSTATPRCPAPPRGACAVALSRCGVIFFADPAAVGPPAAARVSPAVQAAPGPHLAPGGLLLGARGWLVAASRPWR